MAEKRGVGRPVEGVKVQIRLRAQQLAAIDAVAGAGNRAEFIRRAVDQALEREAAAVSLGDMRKALGRGGG